MSRFNYLSNLIRLLTNDRWLRPLVVSYCITPQCNLNCVYCEDFGARRNPDYPAPLPLVDAQRVLAAIRRATDHLIITGGEPLLYPHLVPLLDHARQALGFRSLTLLTNGSLLGERAEILGRVDRLMVSIDAIDPERWDATIRAAPGTARAILDNVAAAGRRQDAEGFRLIVNAVVTPETLAEAPALLDFCIEHDLLYSFSPQSVTNWPHYDLLVSKDYRAFVDQIAAEKRRGGPILASFAYLRMIRDFTPYACYPLLAPRVMYDGALAYPCRPIERDGELHGGRAVNLLEVGSWDRALRLAAETYGDPPATCASCYQQCYAEPSLLQARPWDALREWLAYPPVRRGDLLSYAPG